MMASLRRSSRKLVTVGKKYAKRLTSSSSKLRLVKYKIDKQHQQKLAESKARVERLHREREALQEGRSQTAILCEEVTTQARALREAYERKRPVIYHAVLSAFLDQEEELLDDEYYIGSYY